MKACVLFLILLAILFQTSYTKELLLWDQLSIDCGVTMQNQTIENKWLTDENFIESGLNKNVTIDTTPEELNTLRYFPDGEKNCYNLPLYSQYKYLIRAGFYYGNYDGLNRPPLFYLYINGQFWTQIFSHGTMYVEVIYPNNRNDLELCLVRAFQHEIPFISSLEVTGFPKHFYSLIDNTTFLNPQSRSIFCSDPDRDIGADPPTFVDSYNRMWTLQDVSGYQNVTSTVNRPPEAYPIIENDPPPAVMENAITPQNASDSITTWVTLYDYTVPAFFVLYFNEPQQDAHVNHIRKFHIYIDGHQIAMVDVPQNGTGLAVSLQFNISSEANFTLAPIEGSTFPPILNAMEVFTTRQVSSGCRSSYYSSMVLAVLHVFGILIVFG